MCIAISIISRAQLENVDNASLLMTGGFVRSLSAHFLSD